MVVFACLQRAFHVWGVVVPPFLQALVVPGGCAVCSSACGSAVSASPCLLVSASLGGTGAVTSPLACRHGCCGVVVNVHVFPYCMVAGGSGVEGFLPQGTWSGCGSVFLRQVVRGCVVLQVVWWSPLVGQLVHFRGRHGCPAAPGPGREGRRVGARGRRATGGSAPD